MQKPIHWGYKKYGRNFPFLVVEKKISRKILYLTLYWKTYSQKGSHYSEFRTTQWTQSKNVNSEAQNMNDQKNPSGSNQIKVLLKL
jgi:hypothetical protein